MCSEHVLESPFVSPLVSRYTDPRTWEKNISTQCTTTSATRRSMMSPKLTYPIYRVATDALVKEPRCRRDDIHDSDSIKGIPGRVAWTATVAA